MALKFTIQGLLIYATMAACVAAFVAARLHRRKAGSLLFQAAFFVGCISVVYRWIDVGHLPMQNLFEVFLCLGALMYPISVFCRRKLHIGSSQADMLFGAVVLFPAGFVFSAQPQQLPPALQTWLFAPHVFAYMLSYVFMAKAAVQAVLELAGAGKTRGMVWPERATYILICAGLPLMTVGLVLGCVWGQSAWGDWWGWDPKELWSLASWLLYVGYLHFRYMFGRNYPRLNSAWAITGLLVIVITLLWVNLSHLFLGMHSYAT
jgi:ABC-type transport system involved in cytochrome c biogenesis permease subunit